ncbi:MAG: hypothetical protein PHN51_00110 [Candidatus Nanopelagicales bacterium]|nr:hypothetical protein [Candidatus Nanopelagicales bacterium]
MGGFSRAATLRNFTAPALKALYSLEVQGAENVPLTGPVILNVSGLGVLVAPIVNICSPRPVNMVIDGALREVLSKKTRYLGGDIPFEEPGFGAMRQALDLLKVGQAVGFMGKSPSLGYLVAATGAAVIPVMVTGASGKVATDPPRPRSKIGILFEAPIQISPSGDPCALATVLTVSEQVRQAQADARARIRKQAGHD